MRIAYHGGSCCGIKTICGLGQNPSEMLLPKNLSNNKSDLDWHPNLVEWNSNFFTGFLPEETRKERLVRYIDFIKKTRPGHIIEAVVVKSAYRWDDQSSWFPVLEELGFRIVNSNKNSNTGNIINVFHLNVAEGFWAK